MNWLQKLLRYVNPVLNKEIRAIDIERSAVGNQA